MEITDILAKLQELEVQYNINIIYAVDAGSRSYGCNTETSDYDIRFVYVYNDKSTYLKLSKVVEDISLFEKNDILDFAGFDVRKAMQLLKESNPSILEWLNSPIIYINKNNFKENCLNVAKDMHSHLSLMYHYYHMAKNNWKTWIENKTEIICKKYFYVIRPLSCVVYIMDKLLTSPTEPLDLIVNFDDLINSINHLLVDDVRLELQALIEKKRNLNKKELCDPIIIINNWIESVFLQFEQLVKSDKSGESDVNCAVQSLIKTHRKLTNEAKKIIDITKSCGYTARSNYLSAISLTLQLLWFDANPDKDSRDLPNQIHILLNTLSLLPNVVHEIRQIIDNLQVGENIEQRKTTMTKKDFSDYFIEPGLRCIYKNNTKPNDYDPNASITEIVAKLGFSDKIQNLILSPKRIDSVEYGLVNFFKLLWLLGNVEDVQNTIPFDIVNTGDFTNTIPNNLLTSTKLTIAELRPKYVVGSNAILNNWFTEVITNFDMKVKNIQQKLATLKEENAKKRFHNSIKHVDPQRFDNLVLMTMNM